MQFAPLKPGNQKPFVFRGAVWRKRVGPFPVPTTACSPRVLATASHPLSASITPHHCDGHKGCLRISQEKKVPLFIPPSSPRFLRALLKNKVNSSAEKEEEQREDRTLHGHLQNQQRTHYTQHLQLV